MQGIAVSLLIGIVGMASPNFDTRASQLGSIATGMGKVMRMTEYLQDYSGCRTAILNYVKLDKNDLADVLQTLKTHAAIQERAGRDFWPQIALETVSTTCAQFQKELVREDSIVQSNVRTLARAIARYRDRKKWFFIRPFSEMNDATENTPWQMGNTESRNSPAEFADAWKMLRAIFDQEGATNAIFIFSPLVAQGIHREELVLEALNRIPVGYIDAFGMNVYARPRVVKGSSSSEPIPFAALVQPWMKVLERSKHRGIPLAVPEMGVSSQSPDESRASWIKEMFAFARSHGFVMLTYFNYKHRYWQIEDGSLAGKALKAGVNGE